MQSAIPNDPALWLDALPIKGPDGHKYNSGHLLIYGAPELTGATRLAAMAAARTGVGLVTVVSPPAVVAVYQTTLPAHILVRKSPYGYKDKPTAEFDAVLYGPGGIEGGILIDLDKPGVIDADALSNSLLANLSAPLRAHHILTPHEGEFKRVFPDLAGERLYRAQAGADKSGATIVLKGPGSLIATPRSAPPLINHHDTAYLATAGSGDVLAGVIAGFLAQGMEARLCAASACWIHGEAARRFGPGLTASDLVDQLPGIMSDLMGSGLKSGS